MAQGGYNQRCEWSDCQEIIGGKRVKMKRRINSMHIGREWEAWIRKKLEGEYCSHL